MAQRAIVLFPRFDHPTEVESVRRDLDPLASMIAAHVTLVFPFEDAITASALRAHVVTAVATIAPFAITLGPPSIEEEGYLFLRVVDGHERIIELHDRLYTESLARHLSRAHVYDPHVTVGRVHGNERLEAALSNARGRLSRPLRAAIDGVSAFELEGTGGHIAFTVPFQREVPRPGA